MKPLFRDGDPSLWSDYRPAVHGFPGHATELGIGFANTGGQDSATGTEPIPPSNAGTTALDVAGVAFDGTPANAWNNIITNLVVKDIIEVLRTRPVFLQLGAFAHARHVPGTNNFVYTLFGDLGPADPLLEGVPPITAPLAWDTMSFTGSQYGKLVAITDLAELFSPFELYSQAAEKLAWNAIDTAETQAIALVTGANVGVPVSFAAIVGPPAYPAATTIEAKIIKTVVTLRKAEVAPFSDGNYRALISVNDASLIMGSLATQGWTDVLKYTNATPILTGEIGMFRGVRFIETNRAVDGKTVFFGQEVGAWGDFQTIQAYRVAPGSNHADPLAQRGLLGWKGMWGMKLTEFTGTPAAGPLSNPKGFRFAQVNLT